MRCCLCRIGVGKACFFRCGSAGSCCSGDRGGRTKPSGLLSLAPSCSVSRLPASSVPLLSLKDHCISFVTVWRDFAGLISPETENAHRERDPAASGMRTGDRDWLSVKELATGNSPFFLFISHISTKKILFCLRDHYKRENGKVAPAVAVRALKVALGEMMAQIGAGRGLYGQE